MIEELAPKYGYSPNEIKMEIIGTKPGEKLYEELMTEDEAARSLEMEDMFIIIPEIKDELSNFDEAAYNAIPIRSKDYVSRDVEPLTKDEIKAILLKDGII